MAIDKDIWQKAKALFEIGKSLTDIAEATGINKSSISKRAKNESWEKGKIQHLVDENVQAIQNVEIAKDKIQQEIQHPIQQEVIQKEIDDRVAILNNITNIQKGALNLHNIVIKKTMDGVNSGKLSVREASQVLANTGLKVDQIHRMNNPEQPTTAIQINNTANAVANANLEEIVIRVLSSDDDSIINNLEESC